jgi:multicomponent Na+:H+ antiporter subunit G
MGEVVMLVGAILILLGAVGVLRFPDALARMHALTKASTIGVVLVAVGAAVVLTNANDLTSAIGAALLQLLTLPISASLIARATYLAQNIPTQVDVDDEFAARRARRSTPPRPDPSV